MKTILSLFAAFFIFAFTAGTVQAQDVTVILIRHAEKDTSPGADKTDPNLTDEGRARAQRLVKVVKKYKPTDIYSTNFQRTRATVAPLAESRKLVVQTFDHKKINEIYDLIMKSDKKTFVIAGHNTTTPQLANMLIKQDKYKALDESVYNKMWIIKIKKDKIEEQLIEY